MSANFNRRWARFAAVGALVAALGLSGCGRKGPLDPPPTAGVAAQPVQDLGPGQDALVPDVLQSGAQQPTLGRDDSRIAAPGRTGKREPFILDWLID